MSPLQLLLENTNQIIACVPVGSRVTCDPPPQDTDEDYIVLTHDLDGFAIDAEEHEFFSSEKPDEYEQQESAFRSFRRGSINLIVTESSAFYEKFLEATLEAKRLNLLRKEDRVALFQSVLYGKLLASELVFEQQGG